MAVVNQCESTAPGSRFTELLMRYTPLAAAISLFVAVTASTTVGQAPQSADPRVMGLVDDGAAALAAGDLDAATDRFEAALALDPGSAAAYLQLAEVARAKGMQGQAIRYYREAQERDPGNLAAISGEGAALAEKGATANAERNLAKLQSMCGSTCAEASELAAVIARGPIRPVKSAEANPTVADPSARN